MTIGAIYQGRTMMTEDEKLDKIEYGFMLNDQLLHLQLVEVDWHPTRRTVYELAPLEQCDNTLGEWATSDLMTVLSMRLMPAEWCDMTGNGNSSEQPRPTYGEARAVAIHTKRFSSGALQRLYIPLVIPEEINSSSMDYTVVGTKEKYALWAYRTTPLTVGNYYWWVANSQPIGKHITVAECIAQVPYNYDYLLLPYGKDVLTTKLLGGAND